MTVIMMMITTTITAPTTIAIITIMSMIVVILVVVVVVVVAVVVVVKDDSSNFKVIVLEVDVLTVTSRYRPRDTLACCWNVKHPTNEHTSRLQACLPVYSRRLRQGQGPVSWRPTTVK